jgi:predicted transcriptional regulator
MAGISASVVSVVALSRADVGAAVGVTPLAGVADVSAGRVDVSATPLSAGVDGATLGAEEFVAAGVARPSNSIPTSVVAPAASRMHAPNTNH